MNDILIFALGFICGVLAGMSRSKSVVEDNSLKDRIKELEDKIKYYKDLCSWHVEEKRKLQEIKDKFERECG
jgi:uncharacterized membrane protein YciS (DUF1049 family)